MITPGTTWQLGHVSTLQRAAKQNTAKENSSICVLSSMVASGHWDPGMLETMSAVIQPELHHVIPLLEHAVIINE